MQRGQEPVDRLVIPGRRQWIERRPLNLRWVLTALVWLGCYSSLTWLESPCW